MSHIADLHNNGRCGLHQTIDQARGAYYQLISKESRAADNAFRRQLAARVGLKCPACGANVATSKCQLCGHFPISLPSVDEAAAMAELQQYRPPSSVASSTRRSRVSGASVLDAVTEERIAKLEAMVAEERAMKSQLQEQLATITKLVEANGIAPSGGKAAGSKRPPLAPPGTRGPASQAPHHLPSHNHLPRIGTSSSARRARSHQ